VNLGCSGRSRYTKRSATHPYKVAQLMERIRTSKPGGLLRFTYALIVCALLMTTSVNVGAQTTADKNAKITLVYEHALPNVPGKSIKGVLVEYGHGGSSPAHTHPKSAFIYATVLEGAIRSSVNDGPVVTYRTGQSFSEMPGDRHSVSENASKTEPAKLLAVFVVNTEEKELTTPYKK
jgi:quercetin dioxygenase-like cupin family protein